MKTLQERVEMSNIHNKLLGEHSSVMETNDNRLINDLNTNRKNQDDEIKKLNKMIDGLVN